MTTSKREPGAPPEPCDECEEAKGVGAVCRTHGDPWAAAPVAVSASFSALLAALCDAEFVVGQDEAFEGTEHAASAAEMAEDKKKAAAARARVESLHRDEVERLTRALRDLLESVDLIEAHFDKYGMAGDVIRGFLLGSSDRARAVLGARPVPSGDHTNSSNEEGV